VGSCVVAFALSGAQMVHTLVPPRYSEGMRGYIWERQERGKGVYLLRVDAGRDPVTGKRRQLSRTIRVTGPKPKQQAQQKLTEFLGEVDAGHHRSTPHAGMTVAEAVENWFASFQAQVAAGTKGPGTERKYPLGRAHDRGHRRLLRKAAEVGSHRPRPPRHRGPCRG
jgi:hypothetical protein